MRWWIFALCIAPNITFADREVLGKVNVGGKIVESACTIATGNMWQEVNIGHAVPEDLLRTYKSTAPYFRIRLIHCALEHTHRDKWLPATVSFDGVVERSDDTLFLGNKNINGIAFRIIDRHDNPAHSGLPVTSLILNDNENSLDFKVQPVFRHGDINIANASFYIRLIVDYQ